ncbi:MAG: NAD(P)H-dependent oxidoreductase [Desulfurivibrio sp.]|nr:NAD(P)H-dependent oxidoreductase [Desulfurivibrio sp.]
MDKPLIVGLSASNRSQLTCDDEVRLARMIEEELHEEDFNIHEAGSDALARAMEFSRELADGLDATTLSNSETALLVALASAKDCGVDIEYLSLSRIMRDSAPAREVLLDKLSRCAGVILSSPVYFGDRSSVVQSLLALLYRDPVLATTLADKVFTGISVGAKRNGGQETLLIYQLLDFIEFKMFGVGNDSKSTAQYGGTCTAGRWEPC